MNAAMDEQDGTRSASPRTAAMRGRRPRGWRNAPAPAKRQIAGLVESVQALLGRALQAIYLYGSLARGCFYPARSDLDLLIVVERPLRRDYKLGLAQAALTRSNAPYPLDVLVVARGDLVPWRYPVPCQLRICEERRARLAAATAGIGWLAWPEGAEEISRIAAIEIASTRGHGITLHGPPPGELLPEPPRTDLLDAVLSSVEGAEQHSPAELPRLCQALAYTRAGLLPARAEALRWALETLAEDYQPPIAQVLAAWSGAGAEEGTSDPAHWRRFARKLLALLWESAGHE
jgi:predicted nucleotidyltransferase